jgi:hypothetical protein
MNPFVFFKCEKTAAAKDLPILLHGSLWKAGSAPGTWSETASQWQVYRPVPHGKDADGNPLKAFIADGYKQPPAGDQDDPAATYHQPAPASWAAKSALYSDKQVQFIGVSCYYDSGGHPLEDPLQISGITLSYKIGTVAVVPDNVNNLNAVLGALGLIASPATSKSSARVQPPPKPKVEFDNPPATVVPGDQVRFRVKDPNKDGADENQLDFAWSVKPEDPDVSIDRYGTLTVSTSAQPQTTYTVTAIRLSTGDSGDANIKVSGLLACLLASGPVDIGSIPSDINITLTVQDAKAKASANSKLTVSGDNQSATVNTAFAKPLKLSLTDSTDKPLKGVHVSFSVPSSGASSTLAPASVATDENGAAEVTATANGTFGGYTVTARADGTSAMFHLQNIAKKAAQPEPQPEAAEPAALGGPSAQPVENEAAPVQAAGGGGRGGGGGSQGGSGGTTGKGAGNDSTNTNNAQKQSTDCSSTGASGCSASHTIRDYDLEYWDIGLGLSALGVKEPQYSPTSPQTQITAKNHAGTVFGFANLYPFAHWGNKTSYYPSFVVGIPVTGKVFYQPFFGIAWGPLGWWKKAPLAVNLVWGLDWLNQEKAAPNASGVYAIGHERVRKQMFGVELPVSALVSKIKSIGGSGNGSSTNKASGSNSGGSTQ